MNLISGEPLGVENQRKLKAYLTDELARSLSDDKWKGKNQTIAGLEALDLVYKKTKVQLSEPARRDMFDEIISGLGGFGLLQPLLDDETVTEVMVNGPSKVYVERKGKLEKVDIHFENDEQVIRIIANILRPLGRTINRDILSVDARLPDGSRVNA
ncbi:MAG TPA: CpaF family protein, partial [Anaerolineales bacterium]